MRERWLTLQQTEVPQSALGYLLRPESAGVDDQFVQTRGLQAGGYLIAALQVPLQRRSLAGAVAASQSLPDDVCIGGETNHANTAVDSGRVAFSINFGRDDPAHDQLTRTHRSVTLPDCRYVASLNKSVVLLGRRPRAVEPVNVHQAERPTCLRKQIAHMLKDR